MLMKLRLAAHCQGSKLHTACTGVVHSLNSFVSQVKTSHLLESLWAGETCVFLLFIAEM